MNFPSPWPAPQSPLHLTVIYDLSSYDLANNHKPFSAASGDLWKHRTLDTLPPGSSIDLRLLHDHTTLYRPLVPLTRLLILGEKAMSVFGKLSGSLNQHRGYVHTIRDRPAICTYAPIDCWSIHKKNQADEEDDDDDDAVSDNKDIANTKRSNYFFWSVADFRKLIALPFTTMWSAPRPLPVTTIELATQMLIDAAQHGGAITLDIETRMQDHSLDIIGIRYGYKDYVIPFYGADLKRLHRMSQITAFWRALHTALLSPKLTWVGHNLAFDLSVLSLNYKLPIPARLFDTMLTMHRHSPLTEKSLSHAISFYTTSSRNHKGDICPVTSNENLSRLIRYNADDLYYTELVSIQQCRLHAKDEKFRTACEAAFAIQRVTLLMSLTGIRIDETKLAAAKAEQELAAEQYTRICRLLTANPDFNPNSAKQKSAFFYQQLGYPIIETTKTGAPAAGAKALYKLALKQPNPLIPFIIAAVEAGKAASMMEFRRKETTI
jgi:hypothetical protein